MYNLGGLHGRLFYVKTRKSTMPSSIRTAQLQSQQDWDDLLEAVDSKRLDLSVKKVLEYAREIGAASCAIEEEYLDRDFSASYSAFYSRLYKRHSKLCRRFHFFRADVAPVLGDPDPEQVCRRLIEMNESDQYVGFIVVRPTPHAPLNRAVFCEPSPPAGLASHLLVKADYRVHLLGATLSVYGAPYTQQDSRVGACAQASIWSAVRHFHTRHRGPWASTVDITTAATKIVDAMGSTQIPTGATFLSDDSMVRALRSFERFPMVHRARLEPDGNGGFRHTWGNTKPAEIINMYIDSGIPVILGLLPWQQGGDIGHAVLAVGHTQKVIGSLPAGVLQPTRAEFCEHFLVMDDQDGIYRRMPLKVGAGESQTPYNVEEHLAYLIAPLPDKVFMSAQEADLFAWNYLRDAYPDSINASRVRFTGPLQDSLVKADEVIAQLIAGQIVSRTYLTYGWKYKARILQNTVPSEIKNVLLHQNLPRYVWVTEFGRFDALNDLENGNRRIFGHCVIDATSSPRQDHLKVFHAPGLLSTTTHDPDHPTGPYLSDEVLIPNESEYFPKVRGDLSSPPP
jgi:hypothetical protein